MERYKKLFTLQNSEEKPLNLTKKIPLVLGAPHTGKPQNHVTLKQEKRNAKALSAYKNTVESEYHSEFVQNRFAEARVAVSTPSSQHSQKKYHLSWLL